MIDLLAAVRRVRPLAVLIDDVHRVDPDTMTLLSLAVPELAEHGVLFAVAVRPHEAGSAQLLDGIGHVRRDLVTRILLTGLAAAEIAELVARLTAAAADPGLVTALRAAPRATRCSSPNWSSC